MNIAILCPGPSLTKTWRGPSGFDLAIGVNRAALAYRCDWWVFLDWRVFVEHRPSYRPRIFTSGAAVEHLSRRPPGAELANHEVLTVETLWPRADKGAGWSLYSHTCALMLAWHLGAKRVEVYGADLAGVKDFDGTTQPTDNRSETRWAQERAILERVRPWMNQRGTTLNWNRPQTSEEGRA